MLQYERETLKFQRTKARPTLSHGDFEYWSDALRKILKIGTEFEINLPDPSDVLKKSNEDLCVNSHKGCSRDCANAEHCLTERHPVLCAARRTGYFLGEKVQCPAKDNNDTSHCESCSYWHLDCKGYQCAMFVPFCNVCPFFMRSGDTAENTSIQKDAETIREEMRVLLAPTENVGRVGKSGAFKVVRDDSLINNGGIEIPTVGRRVHWASFHTMCRDILRPVAERGGFVNQRCGQHYHVLAGYLPKNITGQEISELENPMPEIILANLHQLHRRYELAMFWLMSAGEKRTHLTRWARFRQSLLRFSALKSHMQRVQQEMAVAIISMRENQKGKYASVSYEHCTFDSNGDVSRFHIENRIADGVMSAAAVTAWAMLCYALVLKAVRVSQYGIMETGSKEYMETLKKIRPHLIFGERASWGDNRFADTSGLEPYIPWLQGNAKELVQLLKSELSSLGPAYSILYELAEKPISLRRVEGDSWEKIEHDLYGEFESLQNRNEDGEDFMAIQEVIDLASVLECSNLEEWVEEIAANLGREVDVVRPIINEMLESGNYRWSQPIGGVITA